MSRNTMEVTKSKLFIQTIVDVKDDFEEKYERAFRTYEDVISNINEKELHDLLSTTICKEKQHEEISLALMYTILTEPAAAAKAYCDLTLMTHDGLSFVTNNLAMLVAEKYQRLNDVPRKQLLWFLKELIRNQVLNVDNLVWNILRQASGGDISPKNLALVEGLLDIFIEYRSWLEKDQFLIGTIVYTFLRNTLNAHRSQLKLVKQRGLKTKIRIPVQRTKRPREEYASDEDDEEFLGFPDDQESEMAPSRPKRVKAMLRSPIITRMYSRSKQAIGNLSTDPPDQKDSSKVFRSYEIIEYKNI